jgi:hypothetical protein
LLQSKEKARVTKGNSQWLSISRHKSEMHRPHGENDATLEAIAFGTLGRDKI